MNNQPNTSNLLKRDTYKSIKRMEREQLSVYISNIYIKGFEAGRNAATPTTLMSALRDTLISVADIGPTRADAIIKRLSETMKLGGAADQPKTQDPTTTATDAEKILAGAVYDSGMDCCKLCIHNAECNAPDNYSEDAGSDRDKCIEGLIRYAKGEKNND